VPHVIHNRGDREPTQDNLSLEMSTSCRRWKPGNEPLEESALTVCRRGVLAGRLPSVKRLANLAFESGRGCSAVMARPVGCLSRGSRCEHVVSILP